jgi:hypothetical protein
MQYQIQNGIIQIDREDLDKVKQYKWYIACNGYIVANQSHYVGGGTIIMHRILMRAPKKVKIDHINGDKKDNRKKNLRPATHAENMRNHRVRKDSITGVSGVGRIKKNGKFRARIQVNKKEIGLGWYVDINEAISARKKAEITYFGNFRYKEKS